MDEAHYVFLIKFYVYVDFYFRFEYLETLISYLIIEVLNLDDFQKYLFIVFYNYVIFFHCII